ncbi:hypothetical protein GCM10011369_22390 [Neiella marina]|uniref:DUF4340 domain-containing protein n=1 Tax=Neiella marina TaxID=508461 RepID=A0A8J2XPG9_9GAMM|nr:hypothetical protein [Neiella marina]GGA79925.1 hypothetical protein GCM10011369_22390 [Neiella marina]
MYRTRRQLILWSVSVSLIIALVIYAFSGSNQPTGPRQGIFLPMLMVHSPALTQIRIDDQQQQPWLTMEPAQDQQATGWQVKEADDYPVNMKRLAALIGQLSRASIVASVDYPDQSQTVATAPWNTTTDFGELTAQFHLTILAEGNFFRHVWLSTIADDAQWLRVDKDGYSYQIEKPIDLTVERQPWLQPVELQPLFAMADQVVLEAAANKADIDHLQGQLQIVNPIDALAKGKGTPGTLQYALILMKRNRLIAELAVYKNEQGRWLDIQLSDAESAPEIQRLSNWYLALP